MHSICYRLSTLSLLVFLAQRLRRFISEMKFGATLGTLVCLTFSLHSIQVSLTLQFFKSCMEMSALIYLKDSFALSLPVNVPFTWLKTQLLLQISLSSQYAVVSSICLDGITKITDLLQRVDCLVAYELSMVPVSILSKVHSTITSSFG